MLGTTILKMAYRLSIINPKKVPSHEPNLFHEPHQIIEQLLSDDLISLIPLRDLTKLNLKTLVRRLNCRPVRTGHRTGHCAGELDH